MKIALAQINTTVGDFDGNVSKVRESIERAEREDCDLVVFPEQTISGYPAEDLLERRDFLRDDGVALERVIESTRDRRIDVLVGALTLTGSHTGKPIHNSAVWIRDGKIVGSQHKTLLPTYDVFDEARYFEPATERRLFDCAGRRVGVTICEDVWNDPQFWNERLYTVDPVEDLVRLGADVLVVLSASPFSIGRPQFRMRMVRNLVRRWDIPAVFVNLVGGNTTLVFDGNSFALDPLGALLCCCESFKEDFRTVDLDVRNATVERSTDESREGYEALVLGTRDYLRKTGFKRAVIGLSGGIDSSLTAAVAAEAIGAKNVIGVSMPSRYSSEGSKTDADLLAKRLGIEYHVVPIEGIFTAALEALAPLFEGLPADVAEENLQARARGLILMAISNKLGALLLTTGNKSELAVGYCTLYGDMCGGLAVISDVPKTLVYRMCRYVNRSGEIIPQSVLDKPPSAELRPDQKDEDSLPPYPVLDRILESYVEKGESLESILKHARPETALDIIRKVQLNEYKRQQAAPGIRITSKAFGPGRRFPIVQRYHPRLPDNGEDGQADRPDDDDKTDNPEAETSS